MSITILDELTRLVGAGTTPRSSARLSPLIDVPRVDVDDIGELRTPLTPTKLRRLLEVAVPAPFGQGERTLIDPSVRRTWQIPSEMVTVDWDGCLAEVLDEARWGLGLPAECRLTARFHSLLVYEKGDFFLPHQDTPTADEMIGTLVVVLPFRGRGGELVVDDGAGGATTYAPAAHETTLVAWYADRRHEVRPVRSGHRVVLTYDLLATGPTTAPAVPTDAAAQVAGILDRYFSTPARRWGMPGEVPTKLAYLLDHEYPASGLCLDRLKGADADAAALLLAGAERADCEVVLALTDVHEVRDGDSMSGDLIDSDIEVTHAVSPDGTVLPCPTAFGSEEAAGTPSARLIPYEQEYEGYMGNYGETMDRWYRRAALLVWPRRLAFAHWCEAAPVAALRELAQRSWANPGAADVDRDLAGLLPAWQGIVASTPGGGRAGRLPPELGGPGPTGRPGDRAGAESPRADLFSVAADLACSIGDADRAGALLDPFAVNDLGASGTASLVALAERYGDPWAQELLRTWTATRRDGRWDPTADWVRRVPTLAQELSARPALSSELLTQAWARLHPLITSRAAPRTRTAARSLADLAPHLVAVLEAATVLGETARQHAILTAARRDDVLPLLIPALTLAGGWPPELRDASGARAWADLAIEALQARLARDRRAADDWSIRVSWPCACSTCTTLRSFLVSPDEQRREWPLAQDGRRHVEQAIRQAEAPVRCTTLTAGRPYTLVLTKTDEVHAADRRERSQAAEDLERISALWH
ncbi:MAG: 2OG-Fe(II) oxygenase [Austwickia sp.]|nr:2OG-Fe(II) oxygenase [Actinomycetota bacterium]MCB1254112.1 2OG-Fe(II) oxygenase [Austwickia sp.]